MIVMLTGTLAEATATGIVLEVGGVGYALSVSQTTSSALPAQGSHDVRVFVRMVVRESSIELFGFATREERLVFDRLVAITGVGPKLALAVLSTFTAPELASVVMAKDQKRMSTVPGVGKKTAGRLIMELSDVFANDVELRALSQGADAQGGQTKAKDDDAEAQDAQMALLSMGFTQQEAELALEGSATDGAVTAEQMLARALRRLGGRG